MINLEFWDIKNRKGLLIMNLYDEDLNNLDGSRIPILEKGILSIPGKIDNRPINTGASWIIRDENGHKQKYLLSKYCNGKHTFTRYE